MYTIPGAESQQALDLLVANFPSQSGDTATVVFTDPSGPVTGSGPMAAIGQTMAALAKVPHTTAVSGPTAQSTAGFVSADQTIAFARVQYDVAAAQVGADSLKHLQAAAAPAGQAGLQVTYGGPVVDYANLPDAGNGDVIGVLVAIVILLFAFGSVVAMGLPIATALFGLLVGLRSSASCRPSLTSARSPRSSAR